MFPFIFHRSPSDSSSSADAPRDGNSTDSSGDSSHGMATTDRPSAPPAESTPTPSLASEDLLASDPEIQAMCAQTPQPRSGTPQIVNPIQQPTTTPPPPPQQGTSQMSDPGPGPSNQPVPEPLQQPAPPRQRIRRDRSPLQRPMLEPRDAALPPRSPDDFWHYLVNHHPWARHVRPRQIRRDEIAEQQISNDLPVDVYRHVPHLGYAAIRFVHSLFPRTPPNLKTVRAPLAFIEFSNLEDAVIFRDKAQRVLEATLRGDGELVQQERTMAPKDVRSSILLPPKLKGSYPVLYQIAAIGSNSLVIEAKDFFVFMPDRLELHCILLDRFSLNIENNTYGYDRHLISVKDFVWVYEVAPTIAAVRSPARCLQLARIPRTAALETNTQFFFRAAVFAFVTPAVWTQPHLGVVLKLTRRGETVNNFKMALEGVPEAVTITKSICEFEWPDVQEDEILIAQSRKNVSCAVRFSEPPASKTARDWLRRQVEHFCPAHPDEGMVPMKVRKARQEDIDWFFDRTGEFNNFVNNHPQALRRMSKVFSMACAALVALQNLDDDNRTHRVTATVPSVSSHPLQLQLTLQDMSSMEGWTKHRPVGVWIMDVWWFTKLEVDEAEFQEETRELRVTLATYSQMEQVLRNAIRDVGRRVGNTAFLDLFVKLGRTPANANPAFESVSRMEIFKDLEEGGADVSVVDIAYGAQELGCKTAKEAERDEDEPLIDSITLHGRRLELTRDQQEALALGNSKYPLIAIQAAFGTGKTVVGACVAIRQALAGQRVIITASTNTAVAQFANTILEFGEAQQVGVTRFVAEAIAFDTDAPTTAVDLPEILKMIGTVFQRQLTREKETCRTFTQGRIRYESQYIQLQVPKSLLVYPVSRL
ncbi:unnamed protein product [Cylicocyclus nassatus]|uniref:DNA2/NAM7 helicase helicase domain-containing protein n=1 Tax=Cylicocyclus nassatus TaxID=53992 RepID=A0AA36GK88_CYLNA|nr:unnamed protein product [Cylicocyclus nassatus]